MPKIRLELDRLESYTLLAATEFLRQLVSGADELLGDSPDDDGIPFIRTIRPISSNAEYTEVRFSFVFKGDGYVLDVRVSAGDLWPKRGETRLFETGLMEAETGVVRHDFELRGNPGHPQVVFTRMRGGG